MRYIFLLLFLCSCYAQGTKVELDPQVEDLRLVLLFEHDGCKVYRFNDGLREVYYSDCRGQTSWDTGGKHKTHNQTLTDK